MDFSGPSTGRRLAALLTLLLVTAAAITAVARWGPGGEAYVARSGDDLPLAEWTEAAFAELASGSCTDPVETAERLLHPELATAIDAAWGLAEFIGAECGNEAKVIAVVEPPDLDEHFDDELAFLGEADGIWQVALDSRGDEVHAWMVVETDGERRLFSLLFHFYARCATGEEEC